MRLWRVWAAGKELGQDEHRLPELHGCEHEDGPSELDRKLTSKSLHTARTNQGRVAEQPRHLHSRVGRLVARIVDCGNDPRMLPLPGEHVLERLCAAAGHRSRRSANAASFVLGCGSGLCLGLLREGARAESDIQSVTPTPLPHAGLGTHRGAGGYGCVGRIDVRKEEKGKGRWNVGHETTTARRCWACAVRAFSAITSLPRFLLIFHPFALAPTPFTIPEKQSPQTYTSSFVAYAALLLHS